MKVVCSHCGTSHVLKDADVAAHAKVQFRCSKCGQNTVVDGAPRVDSTMVISPLPSFARGSGGTGPGLMDPHDGLKLPAEGTIVLTVLTGPSKGAVHKLAKPRVILGRQGADFALDDTEVSRYHCVIEVKDRNISLKDLDSTNGTFLEDERARAAILLDGGEFRIGSSLIRVTLEPK
jgi:predicted Zn finger-like uncharacterized protein